MFECLFLVTLIAPIGSPLGAAPRAANQEGKPQALTPSVPIERALRGGEMHVYRVELGPDDLSRFRLTTPTINVRLDPGALRLELIAFGSDGVALENKEYAPGGDSESGTYTFAEGAGSFLLRVRSMAEEAEGRYEILARVDADIEGDIGSAIALTVLMVSLVATSVSLIKVTRRQRAYRPVNGRTLPTSGAMSIVASLAMLLSVWSMWIVANAVAFGWAWWVAKPAARGATESSGAWVGATVFIVLLLALLVTAQVLALFALRLWVGWCDRRSGPTSTDRRGQFARGARWVLGNNLAFVLITITQTPWIRDYTGDKSGYVPASVIGGVIGAVGGLVLLWSFSQFDPKKVTWSHV